MKKSLFILLLILGFSTVYGQSEENTEKSFVGKVLFNHQHQYEKGFVFNASVGASIGEDHFSNSFGNFKETRGGQFYSLSFGYVLAHNFVMHLDFMISPTYKNTAGVEDFNSDFPDLNLDLASAKAISGIGATYYTNSGYYSSLTVGAGRMAIREKNKIYNSNIGLATIAKFGKNWSISNSCSFGIFVAPSYFTTKPFDSKSDSFRFNFGIEFTLN